MCTPASVAQIVAEDAPMRDVLDHPPQQITFPLAIDAADSSFTGIDFVPNSFVRGPVGRGAALYTLEGDFGFSASNSAAPFPLKCGSGPTPETACDEIGHEVKLINFSKEDEPLTLKIQRFAKNKSGDQAFLIGEHGWSRPTNLRFGPDGCAWIADYGAVRDFGQSDPRTKFITPGEGPLVQIPGTGVIFRICPE